MHTQLEEVRKELLAGMDEDPEYEDMLRVITELDRIRQEEPEEPEVVYSPHGTGGG